MRSQNTQVTLHEDFDCYAEDSLSAEARKLVISKKGIKRYGTYNDYEREIIICSVVVPAKVDWCDTCNGTGGRSRYDVEGYDIDAMMNTDDYEADMEFREDYFSGKTDTTCNVCNGTKIQNIVDYEKLTKEQIEIFDVQQEIYKDESAASAEADAERRAGC